MTSEDAIAQSGQLAFALSVGVHHARERVDFASAARRRSSRRTAVQIRNGVAAAQDDAGAAVNGADALHLVRESLSRTSGFARRPALCAMRRRERFREVYRYTQN
jgi:hypothetical protein